MYNYVIVHGSYGSPFENWFSWLYNELTNEGKNVLVPQFPIGDGIQNYENWAKVLDAYKDLVDENTIFIGHSLAPAFITDYLILNNLKSKKVVFVAPFYDLISIPEFDAVNSPFFFVKDLSKLKDLADERICLISTTDPYVPNKLSLDFANIIGAEAIMYEGAGHFNKAAGFSTFENLKKYL